MKVFYQSEGEQSLNCDLSTLMGNFRESGMGEFTITKISQALRDHGKFEGVHEFGRFTIEEI